MYKLNICTANLRVGPCFPLSLSTPSIMTLSYDILYVNRLVIALLTALAGTLSYIWQTGSSIWQCDRSACTMFTSYWRNCGESVWGPQALEFPHTHTHARWDCVCVWWEWLQGRWLSKFLLLFICFACAFAAEQTIRNNVDFLQLSLEMSKCQSGSKWWAIAGGRARLAREAEQALRAEKWTVSWELKTAHCLPAQGT